MRTVLRLSPELGNSEIGLLFDAAEQDAGNVAATGFDVEVVHGGDVQGIHGHDFALPLSRGETMICVTFKGVA